MKMLTIALGALFYVLYFLLGLFLGGFALMWGSDYQWWSFALVILVPAALAWATVAWMRRRTPANADEGQAAAPGPNPE